MEDFNQSERFDMWGFTEELQTLMEYRAKYYALKARYEKLDGKFSDLLNGSLDHNQAVSDNILNLCLYGIGGLEK